jgi:hypothetical protein
MKGVSISLAVDCILSLKKIIALYATVFAGDWIESTCSVIFLMSITAYSWPYTLLRPESLVRSIQLCIGFNTGFKWNGLITT